jgi:hypothetical protein
VTGRVLISDSRIDGRVQSLLVGGHDVATVLRRDDFWNCQFFEYVCALRQSLETRGKGREANNIHSNYDCKANDGCSDSDDCLVIPDGVNNLASKGWGTRIRSLMCKNWDI